MVARLKKRSYVATAVVIRRDGRDSGQFQRAGRCFGPVWSPTGGSIAFVTGVYPDCESDACNVERAKAADTAKVKAHITDNLLYRHWNAWTPATRSHLFVVSPNGTGLRDLTTRLKYDVPPGPFGGSEGYAFSPDGAELAFTAKDQGREDAWSTDINVYTVSVPAASRRPRSRIESRADQNPVYHRRPHDHLRLAPSVPVSRRQGKADGVRSRDKDISRAFATMGP